MRTRNFFLFFLVIISAFVVLATQPIWNSGASTTNYTTVEDSIYYHNLSQNITGYSNDVNFSIDTATDISWTNSTGTYLVEQSVVSDWLRIYDSASGNLTINATLDNQTGFFVVPIQATNTTDDEGSITNFEFIINATNDIPDFTLNSEYNVSSDFGSNVSKNISLVGSDEEEHYPLIYNLSINDCELAEWSTKGDCNLTYNMVSVSNTTSTLAFSNISYNDVGVYNLTICVHDYLDNNSLPLYRDSTYDENKSYCQNTTFTVLSSLAINASNCSGLAMENEQFNCTINITTKGESDELNFSSYAFFASSPSAPIYVGRSWFYSDTSENSSNFTYSIPISIIPDKSEVGNWTINFSVYDVTSDESEVAQISLYVNYTESNVSLSNVSNITLYEDYNFGLASYDEDLLISDDSLKLEVLTYASNTSWVGVTSPTKTYGQNYTTSSITINHTAALTGGEGNYSIKINVTDDMGSYDEVVFNIQILNESAPEWNVTLDDPVVLNLVEGTSFVYNVSVNVSDSESDPISFYYSSVQSFCSLTASNFNSSGLISFTPVDCDVGLHNVTIIATDSYLNSSHEFIFNVSNIADTPSIFYLEGDNGTANSITQDFNLLVEEDSSVNFSLIVDDDDFLIPSGQRSAYYNESLIIDVVITNSTGGDVDLFEFSFVEFANPNPESASYDSSFSPNSSHIGTYFILINITDNSNLTINRTWNLTVVGANDAPVLDFIDNQSFTFNDIFSLDINATDEESGNDSLGNLTFSLNFISGDDFVNGNESIFNTTSGEFNLTLNSSYVGEYVINVTVNDSELIDYQVFYLFVYGLPNITSPSSGYIFNWTEDVAISDLNFVVDYGINNTNFSYEFFMDKIVYYWVNESNGTKGFNYTNLTNDSRGTGDFIWNSSTNLSINYTPTYEDESYGMLKNFSLLVYNPDYPELNATFNWSVNVSHANENISFTPTISKKGPVNKGVAINVDLTDYFNDSDYFDVYYNQKINFSLETVGAGGYVVLGSSFSDWILRLYSSTAVTETVKVIAYEWDDNNVSLGSVESNDFEVEFVEPTVVTTPSGGGSSRTVVKFYSLRIIVPQDVIISDEDYIDVPFSLENDGTLDLYDIDLGSSVLYNNEYVDDIKINLGETHLDSLKVGEQRDYTMRILADTDRAGRYKATVLANITTPKFNDWGDFFIDLRKTNESEAEEMLIFTEKIISENPECLELVELFRRAEEAFDVGDNEGAMRLSMEVSEACEDAIKANEQIRYKVEGFVEKNFYYISFATLGIFVLGFVFYIYKRVRFNKYVEDKYNR